MSTLMKKCKVKDCNIFVFVPFFFRISMNLFSEQKIKGATAAVFWLCAAEGEGGWVCPKPAVYRAFDCGGSFAVNY